MPRCDLPLERTLPGVAIGTVEDASQVFSRGAPYLDRGNALTVASAGRWRRQIRRAGRPLQTQRRHVGRSGEPTRRQSPTAVPSRRCFRCNVTSVRAEGDGTNPVLVASKRSCDEITEAIPDLDSTVSTSCGDQVAIRAEGHGFRPGGKAAERSARRIELQLMRIVSP